MSEAKRVTLTTISSTVSSSLTAGSSNTLRFGADFLAPADKSSTISATSAGGNKGSIRTIRLNVELFQTDSNKYPEFNYAKLLHLEKKKLKKIKQKPNGFSDPFEENDDDVARIAKELEKKYANAYSTGRGKNKKDDIDIGMGYDESDSFIDNTEAYDERIPDEVETIEGGFYINCGALEFKKLHTESMTTKTDEIIKMPNRPKKRVISSSSEESSSSGDDDDDSDDDEDDDESGEESTSVETNKSKSSASATTSGDNKKPKLSSSSASAANPAKKKAIIIENGAATPILIPAKKNKEKTIITSISLSASNSPKPTPEELASDTEKNTLKKVEKTTTVKDMLKAQRDNFLKSQTSNGDGKGKSSAEEEEDDDDSSSSDSEDDDDDDSDDNSDSNQSASPTEKDKIPASGNEDNPGNENVRAVDTNLPELDADVLTSIIKFKDVVKSLNMTGKKLQFDDKLSESFLKIDDSLLCTDKNKRNMVFAHLEYQLGQPKYYFRRKVKQLRIKEDKLKSKRALNKLQKAITDTMPTLIANYDAELRRFTELQSANLSSDQPPKMPKKKFPWNTNTRNLLYDVYQVRWTSFPVLGTRKETLEEFITSYMRDKVVEIWPKGWMRYEELQKEIEKRKTAAKKAKEKKKLLATTASGQSSPNPNSAAYSSDSIQISSVSSLAGPATTTTVAGVTAGSLTQPVSFMKQFEDFATRSNANSDAESVASSGTSSGMKRKNTDAARNKPTKAKTSKNNGDQTKTSNNNKNNNPSTISVDVLSPTKRTDHSINHIMSPTDGTTVYPSSTGTSIFSATAAAVSQPSSKHSSNTHVIDLDNYKSVGDILQTSKQLQAAAANVTAAGTSSSSSSSALLSAINPSLRRESSGDSEIEFIGVFPNKMQNKKTKTNSRTTTPNSNSTGNEKSSSSNQHHHNHNNNNNNNNNNSSNRKKAANSGLTNLPAMDVNKMVSALMEMGDELQIKPIPLSSTGQQQQQQQKSQSPTMSQSGSHQ